MAGQTVVKVSTASFTKYTGGKKAIFQVLEIDGKLLRGSAKQQATVSHLLSVVSHQLGVTIAQKAVDTKTNEIPISTEILSAFDVKGMIVTTDALLTQPHFCETVCALDADYVVPVGLNHKQLHHDIRCWFI